jgi:hypothetical protein
MVKSPIFLVAGTPVNIDVAVGWDDAEKVRRAIAMPVCVPVGTAAGVRFTDDGFKDLGELAATGESPDLIVTPRGVQMLVVVTVPTDGKNTLVTVAVHPARGKSMSVHNGSDRTFEVRALVQPAAQESSRYCAHRRGIDDRRRDWTSRRPLFAATSSV